MSMRIEPRANFLRWAWQYMPIIPALGRLRQEDHKLETSLGYTVSLCLKKKSTSKK
jgi:hypothetical protein